MDARAGPPAIAGLNERRVAGVGAHYACGFQAKCNEGRGPDGGRARSPPTRRARPLAGARETMTAGFPMRAGRRARHVGETRRSEVRFEVEGGRCPFRGLRSVSTIRYSGSGRSHRMTSRAYILAVWLAFASLAGCFSVDDAKLKAEVSNLVSPGAQTDLAMAHLESAGFICTVDGPTNIECSRRRNTRIVISCIQRVALVDGRVRNHITRLDFSPTACFGGFG